MTSVPHRAPGADALPLPQEEGQAEEEKEEEEEEREEEDEDEELSNADDIAANARPMDEDLDFGVGDAMLADLGKRVFPGDLLCPRMDSVFTRLHTDARKRKEKTTQQQLDARQKRIEQELAELRVVRGSTDELDYACGRLYTEAEDRRVRLVKKQQEHQLLEDLQFGRLGERSRSTPSLLSESTTGDCHWDRMHAQAQEKEQRLERIRQAKAEREIEYLERHSVHRISEAEEREAFDRLYLDSQQRVQRKEQKRRQKVENEEAINPRKSMQRRSSVEEAAERMHNEAKLRKQRLEEQRRKSWCQSDNAAPRTRSTGAVSRRLDALYQDAERRRTCRELERSQIAREEIDMLARTSVHNAARARIAKEREAEDLERVFERVHNPSIREVMHNPAARDGNLQRRQSQPQLEPSRQEEPEVDDRPVLRWKSQPLTSEVAQQRRKLQPHSSAAKQDVRPPMSARGPLTELCAGRNNARQPRPVSARRSRAD